MLTLPGVIAASRRRGESSGEEGAGPEEEPEVLPPETEEDG